jgi:alpha-tubulin suppressor-like RCC1 family protein
MGTKAWGFNSATSGTPQDGRCATGTLLVLRYTTPVDVIAGTPDFVKAILTGNGEAGLGLTSGGEVWFWGGNSAGPKGDGTSDVTGHPTPVQVTGLPTIADIRPVLSSVFALSTGGDLYAWGTPNNNAIGSLGLGSGSYLSPTLTQTNVAYVGNCLHESLIVLNDGTIKTCGQNTLGGVGDGTTTKRTTWVTINPRPGRTVLQACSYTNGMYVLWDDGNVYGVGRTNEGELGFVSTSAQTTWQLVASDVILIGTSANTGYFVFSDHHSAALGSNNNGSLGAGLTASGTPSTATLTNMVFPTGVYPVQFGTASTLGQGCIALGSDGKIYVWGLGSNGQIGDGSLTAEHDSPVQNTTVSSATWVAGAEATFFCNAGAFGGGATRRAWAAVIG